MPESRVDRALISLVCCLGRSQDDPPLQHPDPCPTRLRSNVSGACGQDRSSREEADKTVEAWNYGSLFSRIRARLLEAYGRVESAPSNPFAGTMVPHGNERGWTRQDAGKLSNDDRFRMNHLLMRLTAGPCG